MESGLTGQPLAAERSGLTRWGLLILGVGLELLYIVIENAVPEYPYYDHKQILYPLLSMTRNGNLLLAVWTLIIYVIIRGISRVNIPLKWGTIVGGIIVLVIYGGLTINYFVSELFVPDYSHIDSIHYHQNTYHLGFSHGAEPSFDYNRYVYIVYQCDRLGLLCKNIDSPYAETNQAAYIPEHDVHFVLDADTDMLYVAVDSDLYPIPADAAP